MAIVNTTDAVKSWGECVPTTNETGNVIQWELSRKYEKEGYESEFTETIQATDEVTGDVNFTPKPAADFTQAELLEMLPLSHLDEVFESQFTSVRVTVAPVRDRVEDFVVSDLTVGDTSGLIADGFDPTNLGL